MATINAILAKAAEYSMDQYASKVIEKLLKIGGDEFLERYLKAVTSRSSATNPRMPLIDSGSPYSLCIASLLTLKKSAQTSLATISSNTSLVMRIRTLEKLLLLKFGECHFSCV
jgi:hypothetical protein